MGVVYMGYKSLLAMLPLALFPFETEESYPAISGPMVSGCPLPRRVSGEAATFGLYTVPTLVLGVLYLYSSYAMMELMVRQRCILY